MQDFPLHSVYNSRNNNNKEIEEMRTMKIWRNILVMTAAMLSLASCSSDDNVERRLSNTQKETYGQNISGSYPGQYVIT